MVIIRNPKLNKIFMQQFFLSLLIINIFFFNNATANEEQDAEKNNNKYIYQLSIDKRMSTDAVSDFSLSVLEGYRQLDDYIFGNTNDHFYVASSYITRFLASSYIHIYTHEVAGHGAPLRRINASIIYYIRPLSGTTYFAFDRKNMPSDYQMNVIHTSGMQASHIFAKKIESRMIENKQINPVYGISYVTTMIDQPTYIFFSKNKPGDDINDYIGRINKIHNHNSLISKSKLKTFAYLDLMNPMIYFSAYGFLSNNVMDIPMLDLGFAQYLPAMRSVLAPYGPEIHFVNHIKINDKYLHITAGYGKTGYIKSWSLGAKTNHILHFDNMDIGAELILWSQPKINKPISLSSNKNQLYGCLAMIDCIINLNNNISITTSAGAKTEGFVEGRDLKKGAIVKLGLRLDV